MKKQTPLNRNVDYKKRWSKRRHWYGYGFVGKGISFGSALAIVLSYTKNGSILWAIIHGILSWIYVIYRVVLKVGWF